MTKELSRHYITEDMQMIGMHMEMCLILLAIKEMQIKTTVRFHFTPTRMAKIKKINNTKY